MRKLNKQKNVKFIVLITLVLMLMSVGYASLNTNLKIIGTAHIAKTVWSVHFSNIVPSSNNNVVQVATAPTASGNTTAELNWAVSLDTPGQVYQFTVDVVNDGTLDAMIETAAEDLLTEGLTTAQKKYLNCTITYINGTEIEQNDRLAAGETKTLKIRLEVKPDATAEDLPQSAETISLSYDINYIRADASAVTKETSILGIGDSVNYSTTLNNVTLNNWKVFYADQDYTYIILDDYLQNSAIDTNQTYFNKLSKNGNYSIYVNQNESGTDLEKRTYLINALSTKSNWDSLLTGTINGKAVNETRSEHVFAMGAPDIELWKSSWNSVYFEETIYTKYVDDLGNNPSYDGWYIGTSENPSTYNINLNEKEGYNNSLYYPHKEYIDSSKCGGYWLSSPSAYNYSGIMRVTYNGNLYSSYYYDDGRAARPVVSLPTNIVNQ